MTAELRLCGVSVGYGSKVVLQGVDLIFPAGDMTCILGPNGSGKTTLLRTVARLLPLLSGNMLLSGRDLNRIKPAELAKSMAVVLTERMHLEQMTGREVVALGRAPHNGFFGRLSQTDADIIERCLRVCGAADLAERPFDRLSDGERQKVLIARALAQQPQVLILDEPKVHLDLRHKLEILSLLRRLAVEQGMTVLLTLHEPDLAIKSADRLVLVRDGQVLATGPVEQVVDTPAFAGLYGLTGAGFNPLTAGVELPISSGQGVFIVGGGGSATPLYRLCARMGIGCATGVLHAGDLDCYTAEGMNMPLVSVPAFWTIGQGDIDAALALARQYPFVVDSGFDVGESNAANLQLLKMAQRHGCKLLSLRRPSLPGARSVDSLDELAQIMCAKE